jgi:hypothetical protein
MSRGVGAGSGPPPPQLTYCSGMALNNLSIPAVSQIVSCTQKALSTSMKQEPSGCIGVTVAV